MNSTRHIERIRGNYFCDDALYKWAFTFILPLHYGQTDGQTDILLRHSPRYAYASRGKNVNFGAVNPSGVHKA